MNEWMNKPIFRNTGYCYCCDQEVEFVATDKWYRDSYVCTNCGSIPRERALMMVMERFYPKWRYVQLHESSPADRGASRKMQKENLDYIGSQYYPDEKPGEIINGFRNENLEALTFEDNSIDLHVTQDVFEHIFNPAAAFKEIARTLKPGGAHIFTTPLVKKTKPTEFCAGLNSNGEIEHYKEPEYHGNPISSLGSLVTVHWGYDISKYIFDACGLYTEMVMVDSLEHGIRAEYIEVLITRK